MKNPTKLFVTALCASVFATLAPSLANDTASSDVARFADVWTGWPESGWSSPVIWENEIWLTTGSDEKKELRAICVDLESGKITKNMVQRHHSW